MDKEKRKKNKISKYDIVKVTVYLDQHFFVFSRYILANVLRISNRDAQKISSDLKKFFVENNLLEIKHAEFQRYVFEILKRYKYDELYIDRYKMMNQFYAKRYPLIILISGTVFIGKSTIATKLSERMNISNMLQTKTISDVMGFLDNNYDNHTFKPFYMDDTITSDEDLIKIYENESRIIRKGANFDIQKGFLEGKALIIEGHHIIPSLFIDKDSNGNLYICTPEPENRNETDREKCMRQEMSTIDQRGIIVPFLLTASEKDQRYLLNNNGLFFQGENISFNENEEKSRIRIKNYLEKFKTIQDYLLKNSHNFVVKQIDLDNFSQLLDFMQDYILEKIKQAYDNNKF